VKLECKIFGGSTQKYYNKNRVHLRKTNAFESQRYMTSTIQS